MSIPFFDKKFGCAADPPPCLDNLVVFFFMAPLSKWLNGWRLRDPWWVFVVSFSLTTPWFCFVTTDERLNTETVFGNLCLCFNIILLRHSMACAPAYRYNTTNVQVVRFSLVVGKYHSTTPPCTATSPWGNTENCDYSPTPPKRIPPRGLLITLLLMGGGRFPMGGGNKGQIGGVPPHGETRKRPGRKKASDLPRCLFQLEVSLPLLFKF